MVDRITPNIWTDYPKIPLPQVLSFIVDNRGKTVPTTETGHKLIATNCIRNENLYPSYEKIRFLSDDTYRNWFRAHPVPGDIIFVCKGTPGRVCMVPDPIDFCIAQDMVALRANEDIVYNRYLLVILRSAEIQKQIYNYSVGDVIPHFKKSFFDRLEIPIPPMKIQRAIGDFYFSFSLKIELNTQINHNLEEQAKAIFKSWFVDFEPFNGKMPKSWLAKTLADVSKIGAGGDKPHCVSEIQTPEFQYPIYSNGLANDGLYGYASSAKIYEESITVSARGTIGFVCLRQEPYVPIVRLITLIPNTCFVSAKYLYLYLKGINISGTGTTQQQLTVPDFQKTSIMVPDNDTMKRFTICADSIFEQIKHNAKEMRTLAQLRDTLLPKLMSGEIDVSEVEV